MAGSEGLLRRKTPRNDMETAVINRRVCALPKTHAYGREPAPARCLPSASATAAADTSSQTIARPPGCESPVTGILPGVGSGDGPAAGVAVGPGGGSVGCGVAVGPGGCVVGVAVGPGNSDVAVGVLVGVRVAVGVPVGSPGWPVPVG